MNEYLLGVFMAQALLVAVAGYCAWNLCQASRGFGAYLGLVYSNSEKFSVFTKLIWSAVALSFLLYAFIVCAVGVSFAGDKLERAVKAFPSLAKISVISTAHASPPDQIENLITQSNNPSRPPDWDTWQPTRPAAQAASPTVEFDEADAKAWLEKKRAAKQQVKQQEQVKQQARENATIAIMSIGTAILLILGTIGWLAFSFILTVGFLHAFTKLWSPGAIPNLKQK